MLVKISLRKGCKPPVLLQGWIPPLALPYQTPLETQACPGEYLVKDHVVEELRSGSCIGLASKTLSRWIDLETGFDKSAWIL